jgi:circadian clock protein KaiC
MLTKKVSTGIKGLDQVLYGGFISQDSYLVRGQAGTGKTTMGLNFLVEGVQKGESALFITLSEPETKIKRNAKLRGLAIDKLNFLDMSPSSDFIKNNEDYNIFLAEEVEKAPILNKISASIEKYKPQRIFIDGLIQLRFLSTDNYNFRKSVQSLIQLMNENQITSLIASELGSESDDDLQFICDGVINLISEVEERKLHISKIRGSDFIKGYHIYSLNRDNLTVYPNFKSVLNQDEIKKSDFSQLSSGVAEIDQLLHGGLERGTNTLITGPTGVGKTSLALTFVKEAAERGERSVLFTFEENKDILLERTKSINIPISDMLKQDQLKIYSGPQISDNPEIFSYQIKEEIEKHHTDLVMIDSISSFLALYNSKNWDRTNLIKTLNNIKKYLQQQNITIIMVNEISNITGDISISDSKSSFLADNVILLRYLELDGSLRRAIGVIKKRLSSFEIKLRDFQISSEGLKVGHPLENLRGILSGTPEKLNVGDE